MAAADGETAQPLGLRERNKREKRDRIIKAAREAFAQKGFEGTTLREVAAAADIGTGTLFLYVKTKEDLLVLVFKHELDPVIDQSFENVPEGDLLTQLLHVFGAVTEHHAHNLTLSRPFLKDLVWVNEPVAGVVADFHARWHARLGALVDQAKARGEIRPEIETPLLVRCSQHLFLSNLRRWVAGRITREELDAMVPQVLGLLLTGLGPAGAQLSDAPAPAGQSDKPRAGASARKPRG